MSKTYLAFLTSDFELPSLKVLDRPLVPRFSIRITAQDKLVFENVDTVKAVYYGQSEISIEYILFLKNQTDWVSVIKPQRLTTPKILESGEMIALVPGSLHIDSTMISGEYMPKELLLRKS